MTIPLETANSLYSWGWKASLVGAAITLVGVGMLWIGTRVRDKDFELRVSTANTAAAHANERAAALELEAAQAKLELERLRARMAPRRLTPEQYHGLKAEIEAIKDRLPPVNFTVMDERETQIYASDIGEAFEAAGGKVGQVFHAAGITPTQYGVRVTDGLLKIAFTNAGIEVKTLPRDDAIPEILIGLKLPP